MHKTGLIESNPNILGGKPIIKGTRIPVKFIFDLLGQGLSIEEILEEYPTLSKEIIKKSLKLVEMCKIP
jgi:uncharacterized protein (DUF433 family)